MLSSATGVDLKQNLCTLVLHSVVEDFSLENIFIRLSIGWTDRRLKISNYLKVAKINLYRMTNIAITTPMIINTHVPKIPPTSIGRLFDDEDGNVILFKLSRKKMLRTVLIFCLKKKYRINYNNRNWYDYIMYTFSGYRKYTLVTLVPIFTTMQTTAVYFVTCLVDTI